MASLRLIAWVERAAWILVYGGCFSAIIGGVARREDATTGTLLMVAGGVALVAGIVLIVLRSRLRTPPATPAAHTQGKT